MTGIQREFLSALADCGISFGSLLAVGSIIQTKSSVKLMTKRILEAYDTGAEITDGLILQILTNLMKEATAKKE